ncbi:hypothetical protein D3C86_1984400 [compost metagenome]
MGVDDFLHLAIERLDVLLARLDQELPVVLAEVPSKEIEALVDMDDLRLFGRQPQPAYRQELLYPGFDLAFQKLRGVSSDHEVVRITHHVDLQLLGPCHAQVLLEL